MNETNAEESRAPEPPLSRVEELRLIIRALKKEQARCEDELAALVIFQQQQGTPSAVAARLKELGAKWD